MDTIILPPGAETGKHSCTVRSEASTTPIDTGNDIVAFDYGDDSVLGPRKTETPKPWQHQTYSNDRSRRRQNRRVRSHRHDGLFLLAFALIAAGMIFLVGYNMGLDAKPATVAQGEIGDMQANLPGGAR